MELDKTNPQKSKNNQELPTVDRGETSGDDRSVEAKSAAHGTERPGASGLMEAALTRSNLQAALKRVKQNKGSPGIDGMTVEDLPDHLRVHWPSLREQLLAGTYQPQPVRRHVIPKSAAASASSASRRCSTDSSSRPSCRSCSLDSTRRSRCTATASGRGAARTMPCAKRSGTCSKGSGGWSTWISRSSSTA